MEISSIKQCDVGRRAAHCKVANRSTKAVLYTQRQQRRRDVNSWSNAATKSRFGQWTTQVHRDHAEIHSCTQIWRNPQIRGQDPGWRTNFVCITLTVQPRYIVEAWIHCVHVEYCVSAWNPHYIKDRKLIEKVQRRFTEMINNMKGKAYEERLQCLKLWTLEERRTSLRFLKYVMGCRGLSWTSFLNFTLDDNVKGTRGHSWKLAKFRCTRDCCKYFLSHRVTIR